LQLIDYSRSARGQASSALNGDAEPLSLAAFHAKPHRIEKILITETPQESNE
jgi:hypothetical protein